MAQLAGISATEGSFSLYPLAKFPPYMAFVALGPVLYFVLVTFVFEFFELFLLLLDLLTELMLHSDSLLCFFFLLLFFFDLAVHVRLEVLELLCLVKRRFLEVLQDLCGFCLDTAT